MTSTMATTRTFAFTFAVLSSLCLLGAEASPLQSIISDIEKKAEEDGGVSFITLGDWGGATLGENPEGKLYVQNVKAVAKQMAETAHSTSAQFIVNTGDNFYWCGIGNTSDFQVKADWVDPYKALPSGMKWYSALGNHEYGYNVSAQIDLASIYDTWVMDDRYYSKRVQLGSSENYVQFIFIDSSPCITEYRSSDSSGWDPCGSEYPTCSLSGGTDKFEGPCRFNEQIVAQDCSKQFTWFKQALSKVNKDDWLIVVGHHPAEEIDVEDFVGAMQDHGGVDMYLNGHAHTLTQYQVDGAGAYITSGAGALVKSYEEDDEFDIDPKTAELTLTPGKMRTFRKVHGLDVEKSSNGHSYTQVFNQRTSGFVSHTFSSDFKSLTNNFMDTDGNVIHSFTITKGSGPAPSPSPSGDNCASYGCNYKKGRSCQCNSRCSYYNDCCSDYDSVCK